ncbi:Formyl transferase [Klebsormidium nitens]|uniref:phosphoribosylglycinamide formyltransferase 1 n=1 Tax=Klebsormidium nitens TaxID=105231 RepID=A0A1Y1HZU9_KLENI|nr:Formyl transferase [Klebsormidium nitens]|eukprot:GAQ84210.1 Formyl transferase [Klebsormidium nitens]
MVLTCRAASDVAQSSDRGQGSQNKEGSRKKRIAVFVSGGGSNYKAIQAAIDAGKVNGEVVAVISDKPGCKATEFASEKGVHVSAYPKSAKFAPEGLSAEDLVQLLREKKVDIVLLAGFLKLLPAELVKAFPQAILNIHPALLPAFGGKGFYGLRVHSAVIKSGAWFSGPTVHFIDENYDAGVIVAQRIVRVLPTDTPEELQARVLKEEHYLYPIVVSALCDGRIRWRDDGVPILEDYMHSSPTELPETSSCRNVQAII